MQKKHSETPVANWLSKNLSIVISLCVFLFLVYSKVSTAVEVQTEKKLNMIHLNKKIDTALKEMEEHNKLAEGYFKSFSDEIIKLKHKQEIFEIKYMSDDDRKKLKISALDATKIKKIYPDTSIVIVEKANQKVCKK